MPQLHFSVDAKTADFLAKKAEARGESLSKYLASMVQGLLPSLWPAGYLESVLGACADAPIEQPEDLPFDEVEL